MKLKTLVAALATVGSIGMISTAYAVPPQCLDRGSNVHFPSTSCTVNSAQGCQDPEGASCSCEGGPGDDIIVGSRGSDVIHGLGGNDIIVTLQGNDLVCAGAGEDFVDAGSAGRWNRNARGERIIPNNQVRLSMDEDVLVSDGDVWAVGGEGDDVMVGGDHEDFFNGNAGKDFLTGGEDDDQLLGGPGNDFLSGQADDDQLDGGADRDTCVGGEGGGDSAINCETRVAI